MDKFFAIVPVNQDPFLITWDLGRRCNYDCSYCPAHRHDNFSPHASLEELIDTTEFLFQYITTIAEHRKHKDFHVSFTGGEPTVNPNFIAFAKYIRTTYEEKYKDKFDLHLSLTTNGAMGVNMAQAVIDNFDHVTVSYHLETRISNKFTVTERIKLFKESKINLKVNVMFHAQYFEECKMFCEGLTALDVKFIPRIIGDDPDSKPNFAHQYTAAQKQWFKDFWNIDVKPTGRPCCGGRTMGLCSSQGTVESNFVNYREFQGWSCSVNWYFLHIEQQTRLIYTHQTCQARLDGTRGPLGSIDAWSDIVEDLRTKLEQKVMPVIVCPNKLCGCGLCTPKSQDPAELMKTFPQIINDTSIFDGQS